MYRHAAYAVALALVPLSASAFGPADYVFMPSVTYGRREIDFKGGAWKKPGEDRLQAWSLGFGYGVTQNWFTEFYRKYENSGDESITKFDVWEWKNKFHLTETSQYSGVAYSSTKTREGRALSDRHRG